MRLLPLPVVRVDVKSLSAQTERVTEFWTLELHQEIEGEQSIPMANPVPVNWRLRPHGRHFGGRGGAQPDSQNIGPTAVLVSVPILIRQPIGPLSGGSRSIRVEPSAAACGMA